MKLRQLLDHANDTNLSESYREESVDVIYAELQRQKRTGDLNSPWYEDSMGLYLEFPDFVEHPFCSTMIAEINCALANGDLSGIRA